MSGGVDSAVALLAARRRTRSASRSGSGSTRTAPDAERACCSPDAVIAARETCHALGLPHVTLDLREEFRRAVVEPFVRGYARGETPNPCVRCNGSFRFAELLAFAERVGAARLATGHYARIVEHRGRLLLARAADARKDQRYMLAAARPAALDRLWFPLGDQTKDETRARGGARRPRAARRAESQEACFLGGDDYRDVPRAARPRAASRARRRRGRPRARPPRRLLALHARPAPRARRRRRASRSTRSRTDAADEHRRRRAARVARPRRSVAVRGRLYAHVDRVEAKLRYRSPAVAATSSRRPAASCSSSTSRRTASRPGRPPCSTRTTPSSAPALVTSARAD